jgi:hypothetical protein
MKFQIEKPGVSDGKGGRVSVGTIIDVKGDAVPAWLTNKGRVVADAKRGRLAVTNPVKADDATDDDKEGATE